MEGLSRLHVYLRYAGRCDESTAVHLHPESLDPFSIVAIMEVGFAFYYARRFAEAAEQIQKAIALEPTWDQLYFGLGLVLLQQKRFDDCKAALRTAVQKEPGNVFSVAALIEFGDSRGFFNGRPIECRS